MRLLAVGDVCGNVGCEEIHRKLPDIKRKYNIDAVIVNGENSAVGNGITPQTAEYIFACGADIITGAIIRSEDAKFMTIQIKILSFCALIICPMLSLGAVTVLQISGDSGSGL